jgi:hypothetical protein
MRKTLWSEALVAAAKIETKQNLNEIQSQGGGRQCLSYAMQKIRGYEDSSKPVDQLRRLIYILHSLLLHQQFGGLRDSEINSAVSLAVAITKLHVGTVRHARFSYLMAEIYMVLSQIQKGKGLNRQSAWSQEVANLYDQRRGSVAKAFELLTRANRASRCGVSGIALKNYEKVLEMECSGQATFLAMIGHLKTLRLMGEWNKALQFSKLYAESIQSLPKVAVDPDALLEIRWEQLVLNLIKSGDAYPMISATRYGQDFHHATYMLEASMWMKCLGTKEFLDKITKVSSMVRRKDLRANKLGMFYVGALKVEKCYDHEIPIDIRIKGLGEIMQRLSEFQSKDKELLVLVAMARFLARRKAFEFAALALSEYEGQCLRLSSGRNRDVLGTAGDMLEKSWYISRTEVQFSSKVDRKLVELNESTFQAAL